MEAFIKSFFSMCILLAMPVLNRAQTPAIEESMTGVVAPAFELSDLDGHKINSQSLKGKYVVLHFAATWCPYSTAEAAYLEKLYQEYKDRNVAVVVIDVKEPAEVVTARLRDQYNLSFPILLDPEGKVAAQYAPPRVPTGVSPADFVIASNLIIVPDGRIFCMQMLDNRNFDSELQVVRDELDGLLAREASAR